MANAIAAITDYSAVLKTIWTQDDVQDLFFERMPLLAMVSKDTDWTGVQRILGVQFGQTNGASSKFSNAKTNKQASKLTNFTAVTHDNFSLFSIDHKLITLSRNDKGAIVSAITKEPKAAMKKLKRRIGMALWGNGGGALGQISAISTNTFTLKDPRNARNLEVGDTIDLSSDNGTGGAGIRAGTLVVSKVNRATSGTNAGVITCTVNITTGIAAAVVNDFVFADGDYGAWMFGVPAWCPDSDPGTGGVPTSIYGMDRTPDVRRLGGVRISATGLQIEEAVKALLAELFNEDAPTTHIFMNTTNYNDLELSLGTRKRYVDAKIGGVGFTGLQFTSPGGGKPVEVYADADCPFNRIYALDLEEFTLASAGEFPGFLVLPGSPQLRPEESTNSFEGRVGGYSSFYTEAPGHNGVAILG